MHLINMLYSFTYSYTLLHVDTVWFTRCIINGNNNDSHLNTGGNKFEYGSTYL
jgi:hypothetical protein